MAEWARLEDLRIYASEVARLADTTPVTAYLLDVGWGVAYTARGLALRRTGEGAESIQPWPWRDTTGPYVDVSWDQDHFYMSFHEFGTSKHPRRPAVGPALDRYIHT